MNCTTFTGEAAQLCEAMAASALSFDSLVFDMNSWFLIWAGSCVFFMHLGFAMLSAGAVRVKNTKNILFCIMLDACMCAIGWWLCGWAFAFGEDAGSFIGTTGFVGIGLGEDYTYTDWFFQYAFAATAATIVSGAVAERASFEAYLSYSFLLSIWVYPVIVHFVWGGGFLTLGADSFLGVGAFDFAGDGVIHITGGLAGLIGSYLIGPRRGRFTSDGEIVPMPGHSAPLAMLGTFILWFGWFGFNSGSVLVIVGSGNVAGRAAVNTLLASASGAISSMFYSTWKKEARDWDLGIALNGTLAGLVSITASCAVVETWAAIIIGFGGGILYVLASEFTLVKMRIDDPLDATAVHLFCGAYGLLVTGFFAKSEFMVEVLSDFAASSHKDYSGVFYEGNGSLLAANFVELIVVVAWVTVFIGPYFYFLKRMGWFRISADHEAVGIDESSHGGNAYPEHFNDEVFKPTKEQDAQQPVVDAKTVPPTAAEAEAEATSTSADNGALQQV